ANWQPRHLSFDGSVPAMPARGHFIVIQIALPDLEALRQAAHARSRRPAPADRVAAVPADGGGADRVEDPAARLGHVGHLDHRSGMAFVPEIDEAAARAVALLADRVPRPKRLLQDVVVVDRPARPVLHALVTGSEEIAIHAGRRAALLDQL